MEVIRYRKPNKLDCLEYGTVMHCLITEGDPVSYYVQISKDKDEPHWVDLGGAIIQALGKDWISKENIGALLKALENNKILSLN